MEIPPDVGDIELEDDLKYEPITKKEWGDVLGYCGKKMNNFKNN